MTSTHEPWTASLVWTPDQNADQVSTLHGRIPVTALIGQALAGDDPAVVAADFDVDEATVRLLLHLREDLLGPPGDAEPEPRFATCTACRGRVDRLRPHVVVTRQVETVGEDLMSIQVADSAVTALYHRDCAESTVPAARPGADHEKES